MSSIANVASKNFSIFSHLLLLSLFAMIITVMYASLCVCVPFVLLHTGITAQLNMPTLLLHSLQTRTYNDIKCYGEREKIAS